MHNQVKYFMFAESLNKSSVSLMRINKNLTVNQKLKENGGV